MTEGKTATKKRAAPKKTDKPVAPEVPAYLQRTRDKVAIVGFAHTKAEAPFDNPEYEIWGINRLHASMPDKSWDRYFQLHDIEQAHGEDEAHLKWLRSQSIPVYVRPDDMGKFGIPGEVPFPKQALVDSFGSYFTNTVSWLLALAISFEYKEIAIYGVDMAVDMLIDSEYAYQRPSCEYFLGVAAGLGITVSIPAGSDLLKATHLYGFETGGILREKYEARTKELAERKNELAGQLMQADQQRAQMIAQINQMDGAAQDVQYWLRNWAQSPSVDATASSIESTTGD